MCRCLPQHLCPAGFPQHPFFGDAAIRQRLKSSPVSDGISVCLFFFLPAYCRPPVILFCVGYIKLTLRRNYIFLFGGCQPFPPCRFNTSQSSAARNPAKRGVIGEAFYNTPSAEALQGVLRLGQKTEIQIDFACEPGRRLRRNFYAGIPQLLQAFQRTGD